MTMREKFKAWWLASKYHQVVWPQAHWEQIALDGWCAAYRAGIAAAIKAVEDAGGDNADYHVAAIRSLEERQ